MESAMYKSVIKNSCKSTFHSVISDATNKVSQKNEMPAGCSKLISSNCGVHMSKITNLNQKEKALCESFLCASQLCEQNYNLLEQVSSSIKTDALLFCQALFLNNCSRLDLSNEDITIIHAAVLHHMHEVGLKNITVTSLPNNLKDVAENVMNKNLHINHSLIPDIDAFELSCFTVNNIIKCFGGTEEKEDSIFKWSPEFKDIPSIVWYVVDFVCQLQSLTNTELQDVFSNERICAELDVRWIVRLRKMEKCLTVLEFVVTNSSWAEKIFKYRNFTLITNLSGFFSFCLENLFQNSSLKQDKVNYDIADQRHMNKYLKECIFHVIKILNSLANVSFSQSPSYETELNSFGTFLGKRIMFCVLELNKSSFNNKFEMQILCLETFLMIWYNKWIKRKDFSEIMFLKISIGNEKNTAAKFMIKALLVSLKNIKSLENAANIPIPFQESSDVKKPVFRSILNTRVPMGEEVELFGEVHFEENMLIAYMATILGVFSDINQPFKEIMYDSVPLQYGKACFSILQKFMEFLKIIDTLTSAGKTYLERAINVFEVYIS